MERMTKNRPLKLLMGVPTGGEEDLARGGFDDPRLLTMGIAILQNSRQPLLRSTTKLEIISCFIILSSIYYI